MVDPHETVQQLVHAIKCKLSVKGFSDNVGVRLFFQGKPLRTEFRLHQYGIGQHSTLFMQDTNQIRGGMEEEDNAYIIKTTIQDASSEAMQIPVAHISYAPSSATYVSTNAVTSSSLVLVISNYFPLSIQSVCFGYHSAIRHKPTNIR